jgi:hypothetical protein
MEPEKYAWAASRQAQFQRTSKIDQHSTAGERQGATAEVGRTIEDEEEDEKEKDHLQWA